MPELTSSRNVARFLQEAAMRVPTQRALAVAVGRTSEGAIRYDEMDFRQLDVRVAQCCHWLRKGGVERGTRVLLMVKPGKPLILLAFALFRLGAVPVIIDPGMGLRSFLTCVARTKPTALVGIPLAHGVGRLAFRAFRSVEHWLRVPERQAFDGLLEGFGPVTFDAVQTGADEVAAVLFTSGSTGAPKGVVYHHGAFEAQVAMIRDYYAIQPGEIDLPMLPIFALFNPAMGMTTVVPEMNPSRPATVDPRCIVQAIQQNAVTSSFGSPVLWAKIARYCEAQGIVLPTMKRVLMAGAPVPPAVFRSLQNVMPHAALHSPYGATECLPVSSISAREVVGGTDQSTMSGAGTCVGSIFSEVELKIIQPRSGPIENLEAAVCLPAGEIGEILVSGPTVTHSYDQLPEATALAKVADGGRIWHRMGDLGYLDVQGRLWFVGRKAERVEIREGEFLYSDACEGIANTLPGVFRTALIGLGGAPRQVPALVVEPEPGFFPKSKIQREAFSRRILDHLAGFPHTAKINTIFFHPKFPVDVRHNAKIHRLTLKIIFERKTSHGH